MKADAIGLYVHIPFCVKKCNYCDFCSYTSIDGSVRRDYLNAIIGEILSYKSKTKVNIDTVFFGGGTPSLLTAEEILLIWEAVLQTFDVSGLSEFTIEANPKTLRREMIPVYKKIGINRISIGMQSIHENELKKLGRIHNHREFLCSYELARENFENVSVDVMYGIPEQTEDSFRQTLDEVIALKPNHISVYGLIIEEGTPFYNERNTLRLPDEDTERNMYFTASRMLNEAGYSHYKHR